MPEVQTSSPGAKLARRYGIKAQVIAPSLEPVIIPVVLIDDLTDEGPELRWATASGNVAAAVGEQGQSGIQLPIGSKVLIENVTLVVSGATGNGIGVFEAGPVLTGAGATSLWEDQRRAGAPELVVSDGTDIGAVARGIFRGFISFNPTTINLEHQILSASFRIHVIYEIVNDGFRYTWRWSERTVSAEEAF